MRGRLVRRRAGVSGRHHEGHGTLGYLARHLRFPIEAAWESEHGRKQTVTILGLSEPDEDQWADGLCGLLCQARLQGQVIEIALADCKAKPGSPDRQLLADYGYWFGNWG